jgi:hypothetical protein
VGGGQSGDGDNRKGRPTAQLETAISGQSEGPAPQPGPDQIESAAPTKKPALAALGHVWRGVRHTKLTDWLIIMLTAVIAYSAWSSDKTFGRQLDEMRTTSAQTDHAIEVSIINGATVAYQAALTDRALTLAERNSGVASGQLATAQDTERRQLRAYVVVSGYGVQNVSVGGTPWARIHIYNSGLTPVRQEWVGTADIFIAASAGGRIKGGGTSADCYRKPLARDARVYDSIKEVFPTVRTKTPLTQAQYEGLMAGRLKLVAVGFTCYRDIFRKPHRTDFCLEYSNAQPAPFQEAAVCVRGNKSD